MIFAGITTIYCLGAIIFMLLLFRGLLKMRLDEKVTEDDLYFGGVVMFVLVILIGLHGMLAYALTVSHFL